jgi:hypothetical protein
MNGLLINSFTCERPFLRLKKTELKESKMGYRSDVALAIAPEAAAAFMAMCAKHPKVLDLCHEADDFKSGYEQEGDYFMYWCNIKWYDNDPEIAAINTFVEHLDADDLTDYGEICAPSRARAGWHVHAPAMWHEYFKFIRIGEDDCDVTNLGWGFDGVGYTRNINF